MTNDDNEKSEDYRDKGTSTTTREEIKTPSEKIEEFPTDFIDKDFTSTEIREEKRESEDTKKALTPLQESQKELFEAKTKKENIKKVFFKFLMWVIGISIPVLIGFALYKMNNISEPIGAIKNEIEHLKESNKGFKDNLKDLEVKIDLIKNRIPLE